MLYLQQQTLMIQFLLLYLWGPTYNERTMIKSKLYDDISHALHIHLTIMKNK